MASPAKNFSAVSTVATVFLFLYGISRSVWLAVRLNKLKNTQWINEHRQTTDTGFECEREKNERVYRLYSFTHMIFIEL